MFRLPTICRPTGLPTCRRCCSRLVAGTTTTPPLVHDAENVHTSMTCTITKRNIALTTGNCHPWTVDSLSPKSAILRKSDICIQPNHARILHSRAKDSDTNVDPPPVYKATDLARDVFNQRYFYVNEEHIKFFSKIRNEVLQSFTVEEVYMDFTDGGNKALEWRLSDLAAAIGAIPNHVKKYYAPINMTLESKLGSRDYIVLNVSEELGIFRERSVDQLPILETIWDNSEATKYSEGKPSRALKLGIVLGSSGSGKTFFCLQYLANRFLRRDYTGNNSVTLYFYANRTGITFINDNRMNNPIAAKDLCAWIKHRIAAEIGVEAKELERKLDMHICIVIDEAGDLDVKDWFEDREMLVQLCQEAAHLARSVAVVVSGTALTGRELSSVNDAYFFRMKSWGEKDFGKISERMQLRLLGDVGHSNAVADTEEVAEAIYDHPVLGALATNARSAYFLARTLAELSLHHSPRVWSSQLDAWAPFILTHVVQEYICSNGIQNMSPQQRRRIAASIFFTLHKCEPGETSVTEFHALKSKEMAVAASLVQYNVERRKEFADDGKKELVLLVDEDYPVTISPAIAVVLYTMAGIPTSLMSGWKAEEMLVALYAVRQLMLASMTSFVNETSGAEQSVQKDNKQDEQLYFQATKKLNSSLAEIRIISLNKQVKPDGQIVVPMVGTSTILLNGASAPFADVIAPNTLFQVKQCTSKKILSVDLVEELHKCTLLEGRYISTRALRGLVAMWRGMLMSTQPDTRRRAPRRRENRKPQNSAAFPENLLRLVPKHDEVKYATIQGDQIVTDGKKVSLPTLQGSTIYFVLATNVDKITLRLDPLPPITIDETSLDKDLEIDDRKLSVRDGKNWVEFLKRVRQGIKIRFLLTRAH